MNGLRRGYRRIETGHYRNLFNQKYIDNQPKRDWLSWRNRPASAKYEHHPLIMMLILLLIIIGCFASALICALPFRLIFH